MYDFVVSDNGKVALVGILQNTGARNLQRRNTETKETSGKHS